MAVAANKRSVMTLFTTANDLFSHQVRIVLAEKGVTYDTVVVESEEQTQELAEVNSYCSIPTLVDRELVLYRSHIINEYLDERFPHPPLMPVYPVGRARSRVMMHRIMKDWYSLYNKIISGKEVATSRQELRESILSLAPLFAETPYFLSDEFSLTDCVLAPLLWRLQSAGIELTGKGSKDIKAYMTRLFERESFKISLTETERELAVI